MPELIASLDPVAVLREKRKATDPDPVAAAVVAEMAGVAAVAVHLRGDRKYVQERDVRLLRELVKTRLHLALPPVNESVKIAYAVKPDLVSLVPERHEEISSSKGLDVILNQVHLKKLVRALREGGVKVALLSDPDPDQVKATQTTEADAIILNTRLYADTAREKEARDELDRVDASARIARKLGLRVMAGHGLDYTNVRAVARIREIEAIEVGHALIARAVFCGLEQAVRELRAVVADARSAAGPD